MSGVNAHAIFSAPDAADTVGAAARKEQAPLQRQHFWAVPWPHKLVGYFRVAASLRVFLLDLKAADLAFMLDHQVGFCSPHKEDANHIRVTSVQAYLCDILLVIQSAYPQLWLWDAGGGEAPRSRSSLL